MLQQQQTTSELFRSDKQWRSQSRGLCSALLCIKIRKRCPKHCTTPWLFQHSQHQSQSSQHPSLPAFHPQGRVTPLGALLLAAPQPGACLLLFTGSAPASFAWAVRFRAAKSAEGRLRLNRRKEFLTVSDKTPDQAAQRCG